MGSICCPTSRRTPAAELGLGRAEGEHGLGHAAYIPKGPVLDWLQLVQCNALFAQMNTLLRAQDVLTLRMELAQVAGMASSERIAEQVAALGFRPARAIQPIRTILLDLTYDEETLLARMKEKCR